MWRAKVVVYHVSSVQYRLIPGFFQLVNEPLGGFIELRLGEQFSDKVAVYTNYIKKLQILFILVRFSCIKLIIVAIRGEWRDARNPLCQVNAVIQIQQKPI